MKLEILKKEKEENAHLFQSENKSKYIKIGTLVLILLIGFSRIYLGVHYTTDVLAGLFLAIAYLMLFIKFTSKEKKNEDKKE